MFYYSFIILYIVLVYGGDYLRPEDLVTTLGENFVDSFESMNNHWRLDGNKLYCMEVNLKTNQRNKCVYKSENNTQIIISNIFNKHGGHHSELVFLFRNDCSGAHCCEDDYCTTISAGGITSKHMYTFGTFRFLAQVVGVEDTLNCAPEKWCFQDADLLQHCHEWSEKDKCENSPKWVLDCCKSECGCKIPSHSVHDVLTCFMLENKLEYSHVGDGLTSIGMCVPSMFPETVSVIFKHGDTPIIVQRHSINANAGKKISLFRLDWNQDKVIWYVNGEKLHEIHPDDYDIPNQPLYIKSFVVPRHKAEWRDTGERFELRARLLRVRYRRFALKEINQPEDSSDNGELFVKPSESYWIQLCLLLIATIVGLAFMSSQCKGFKGDYVLLKKDSIHQPFLSNWT